MKTKKIMALAAVLAAGVLAPTAAARAQSFNCLYAKLPAEVAICQSSELRRLDYRVSKKYWAWMGTFRSSVAPDLYQRDWLRRRNNCGANTSCLRIAYETRLYELENGTDDE
jgi:uncharacterized protein